MTMQPRSASAALAKPATGIAGLDELTGGGLPRGRPTLVCGAAGCGKTLLALEFLLHGAQQFGEPGVFMAFEETPEELAQNAGALGFDLPQPVQQQRLGIDYVRVERSEIDETGEYDLDGLFIRLGHAIDRIAAKRVVLDTVEVLFAGLDNAGIVRAELRRLFRWLKDKGVTAVITGERGEKTLTRHGLEEYVSDCVILLDHRVREQVSTRRLRIVKYRGTPHGTNEYPFIIDEAGISVIPITSLELQHPAASERLSCGVPLLDAMLVRLIDHLKQQGITAVLVNLSNGGEPLESTRVGVSSLIDTWILLRDIELGGERNRGIYVLKSRGSAHSNQSREFTLTGQGIELRDVCVGPEGVLTGSMRQAQEAREQRQAEQRQAEAARRQRALDAECRALEAQIAALQQQLIARVEDMRQAGDQRAHEQRLRGKDRDETALSRKADAAR